MNPFSFLSACLLVILAFASQAFSANAADPPPNFIIIFTDDQGYGDLSCYGSTRIATPHIDRLADEGVRMTSFYVTCPYCTPSRAALLTGSYHRRIYPRNGVLFPGDAFGLHADEVTIAEVLKQRDYATACIGKWHLGDQSEFLPTRQGFDEYFGIPYSNDMHLAGNRRFPPLPLLKNEQIIETEPDQDQLTRRLTEYTVNFIERHRDQPFFVYLAHPMPHRPCHASDSFMKRFSPKLRSGINGEDKKSRDFIYPACIEEIDRGVGQIVATLERLNLDERTMIVFTSDNGPAAPGDAGPLRGGKGSTWEGGMRVPFVAWWPGRIAAGKINDEVASTIDLLPTFAMLAGAALPDNRTIDGRDIWPVMAGHEGARSPHEAFFYYRGRNLEAVRAGEWKLRIANRRDNAGQLYNLNTDIAESHDVAELHPPIIARLSAHLDRARAELGDADHDGAGVRPLGEVSQAKPLTTRREIEDNKP